MVLEMCVTTVYSTQYQTRETVMVMEVVMLVTVIMIMTPLVLLLQFSLDLELNTHGLSSEGFRNWYSAWHCYLLDGTCGDG